MHDNTPPANAGTRTPRPQAHHPGAPDPQRLISVAGRSAYARITLPAGINLRDALCDALAAAGIAGATVRIEQLQIAPLHYLMPALSPDQKHAAFYSAPHCASAVLIDLAVATVGRRDGLPFVHCHAVWQTGKAADDVAGPAADVLQRGGHLLCDQSILAAPAQAEVWGLRDATMETRYDAETDFTLFMPVPLQSANAFPAQAHPQPDSRRTVLARIRPGEDLLTALEAICCQHALHHAIVRGSVGSIVGAVFCDGREVDDVATEILVRSGRVDFDGRDWHASLDIALINPRGEVCHGMLAHGQNPVLICFELVLEEQEDGPACDAD